ncbi:hypothetical protein K1W69_19080 [Hoeflea sp. WL0058]|uniref:Uncharacterized protein n=1 Tax=Flavimaribacter sediminis TaxID=2865987 RepID=A0AAE3D2Y4_9HYPH|nr:hypothetical protein [Flavimaribacter sediminis]
MIAQSDQFLPEDDQVSAAVLGVRVILLGRPDDDINHIGKAPATLTALLESMVDLDRNDQLPAIFIEKSPNRLFDFTFGNDVAVTGNHAFRLSSAGPAFVRRASPTQGKMIITQRFVNGKTEFKQQKQLIRIILI